MLHWLPTAPDRKIIYNDRDGDRFVAVVLDVFSGEHSTHEGTRQMYAIDTRSRS